MKAPSNEPPRWDPETERPSGEIIEVASILKPGSRVLDAGCGAMAANALLLAEQGHEVHALDKSEEAIQAAQQRAVAAGVALNAWVADVVDIASEPAYDLVICRGVLHFLSPRDLVKAISNLKKVTTPGGLNAISVFDDGLPIPLDLRPLVLTTPSKSQMERWYSKWHVRRCESYVLDDHHPGGIHHRHSILRFLTERPA